LSGKLSPFLKKTKGFNLIQKNGNICFLETKNTEVDATNYIYQNIWASEFFTALKYPYPEHQLSTHDVIELSDEAVLQGFPQQASVEGIWKCGGFQTVKITSDITVKGDLYQKIAAKQGHKKVELGLWTSQQLEDDLATLANSNRNQSAHMTFYIDLATGLTVRREYLLRNSEANMKTDTTTEVSIFQIRKGTSNHEWYWT
jgi:hypothetical protein